MMWAGMPAAAAVVAAPILKLWPAQQSGFLPTSARALRIPDTNCSFSRGFPSSHRNREPLDRGLTLRYMDIAFTGQMSFSELFNLTFTPFPKGSVLDLLNRSWKKEGR